LQQYAANVKDKEQQQQRRRRRRQQQQRRRLQQQGLRATTMTNANNGNDNIPGLSGGSNNKQQ
jgi:hypothetical protein